MNPNAVEIAEKREAAISAILEAIGFDNVSDVMTVEDTLTTTSELEDFFRVNSAYRLNLIRFLVETARKAGVEEGKRSKRKPKQPEIVEEEPNATEPVAEPG